MSQPDDRREQRKTVFDARADTAVSSGPCTSVHRGLFDGARAGVVDPYPVYARLRAEDPIHRTSHGLWVLTRYAHVSAVLRDPRFGREGFERHFGLNNGVGSDPGGHRQSMLFRDPPHHTRLRDTVTDPLNHTRTFGYSPVGALTSITDPLNHTTTITPHPTGQPATITDALSHTTQFGYDAGDLLAITDALGRTTQRFLMGRGASCRSPIPLGARRGTSTTRSTD
jgi:YD repeat-containing protein